LIYSFGAVFFVVSKCWVLTALTSLPIVFFRSGLGVAEAMQYFKFSPSRRLEFVGGCFVVHRLWNARLVGCLVIKDSLILRKALLKFLLRDSFGSEAKP